MKSLHSLALVLALIAARTLSCDCAMACSLVEGSLLPSNYDLVKSADAIVVARASSYGLLRTDSAWKPSTDEIVPLRIEGFRFDVVEVVKGNIGNLPILGDGGIDPRPLRDSNDFRYSRGPVRPGPCNADGYRIGALYVLFLDRGDHQWYVAGAPFSRINEETPSLNGPWVRAVRTYVRIAALDNYDAEKAALRDALHAAASRQDPERYPEGLAADIAHHFRVPYPTKSFADLYSMLSHASGLDQMIMFGADDIASPDSVGVLWAIARGRHPEARDFVRSLARDPALLRRFSKPIIEYLERTRDSAAFDDVVAAIRSMVARNQLVPDPIIDHVVAQATDDQVETMLALTREQASSVVDVLDDGTIFERTRAKAARRSRLMGIVTFASWFIERPRAGEVLALARQVVDSVGEFDREVVLGVLAALGDSSALAIAEEAYRHGERGRWIGLQIIAESTTPRGDSLRMAMLAGGLELEAQVIGDAPFGWRPVRRDAALRRYWRAAPDNVYLLEKIASSMRLRLWEEPELEGLVEEFEHETGLSVERPERRRP